jgi:phosphatidylserine decarboxylase
MIRIHKEGRVIFSVISGILIVIALLMSAVITVPMWILLPLYLAFALLIAFVARFFRVPDRTQQFSDDLFYSPADGRIVVIEETTEEEYFKERRLQVSVFMSVWDVHINFFPFSGKVKYYKYHPGKFLVAINPKSSTLNERTSIVIENGKNTSVLLRQIAGAVARRIVSYSPEGKTFKTGEELGFIKFGSRVDIFFPVGTEILVKPGEQVYGSKTPIARISL